MDTKQFRIITFLSLFLALSLAVVSYLGAFNPNTYVRDSVSMGAQGIGQDWVDLFLVVPLLLISLYYSGKMNRIGLLLLAGTLFYILYSFVIYSFGVHFNQLFLLYCFTLSLAIFAFIFLIHFLNRIDVKGWFKEKQSTKALGVYLILIAVMFYMIWLKEIIPALINNDIPDGVRSNHLLVNPIHVLDISFALPGLILAGFLILRKDNLGYILAPIGLLFTIILALAIIGMVIVMKAKHVSDDTSILVVFIALAILSLVFLILFLRGIKK